MARSLSTQIASSQLVAPLGVELRFVRHGADEWQRGEDSVVGSGGEGYADRRVHSSGVAGGGASSPRGSHRAWARLTSARQRSPKGDARAIIVRAEPHLGSEGRDSVRGAQMVRSGHLLNALRRSKVAASDWKPSSPPSGAAQVL
jgi:hypothetical protein